jgi:hypothetical protein
MAEHPVPLENMRLGVPMRVSPQQRLIPPNPLTLPENPQSKDRHQSI